MSTSATSFTFSSDASSPRAERDERLRHLIEEAAHLLPAQGPITAFVHHNTLHAFEEMSFQEAVVEGARTFGCHPYLPERRYREELARGRIQPEDIEAVLIEELGDRGDELLGFFGTRFQLQMAILAHPLRTGPVAELRWIVEETDALRTVRSETPLSQREQLVTGTRRWVMRDLRNGSASESRVGPLLDRAFELFDKQAIESWDESTWESFTLHTLWLACSDGAMQCHDCQNQRPQALRHRDLLLEASGRDSDRLVNDVLIRYCAAFLDQGFSAAELPGSEEGFYKSFLRQYSQSFGPPDRWLRGLRLELKRFLRDGHGPIESIEESLQLLGVEQRDEAQFLAATLLALRGFAGMIWQLETRGDRAARSIPTGSLLEFLAIRLVLDRLALAHIAKDELCFNGNLAELSCHLRESYPEKKSHHEGQLAFELFQLAQVIGWTPSHLCQMSDDEWTRLISEVQSFAGLQRRRIYHLAYERRYRLQALDAVACHSRRRRQLQATAETSPNRPSFQVVCCIDEREESFRRHLEEFCPSCETFGAAGFYAVAMYYRGAADAHFTPLCPVIIKPQHYVTEEAAYTVEKEEQRNRKRRRAIGTVTHRAHVGSRTFTGGWIAAVTGSLASLPLVMRILFPRAAAQLSRLFGSLVRTPQQTNLRIERTEHEPGPDGGHVGYTVEEMAGIVERVLRDIGMTKSISRLVIVCGHGSSSMNNPHESAHDCGACSGGRGGPNARAFAQMANDPRVRERLEQSGMLIPQDSMFIGAYHNTCDDSVAYFDLDRLPSSLRVEFETARVAIDAARARSAHERCRRFETAELSASADEALRHVEERAEDLSQVRPEYGHATNALCFVGRRDWSRGLYLDRRAFLQSYEPQQDDAAQTILTRILQAVIPVCAGINLEYYFSYVDPTGYGCGTKLPHNITSLLGVMNGAASDLLPGLPWQMVEIHEPVRLLFVVETTTVAMRKIIESNEGIARLVKGGWVQLATLDPESEELHIYRDGEFVSYRPTSDQLPEKATSLDWYRGWRDHLGFASIAASDEYDLVESEASS